MSCFVKLYVVGLIVGVSYFWLMDMLVNGGLVVMWSL